jgi:hypothetical protein
MIKADSNKSYKINGIRWKETFQLRNPKSQKHSNKPNRRPLLIRLINFNNISITLNKKRMINFIEFTDNGS